MPFGFLPECAFGFAGIPSQTLNRVREQIDAQERSWIRMVKSMSQLFREPRLTLNMSAR